MAVQTISLIRFIAHPDGRYEFVFANSISGEMTRIYQTLADVLAEIGFLTDTEDIIVRYLLGYWNARDTDFSNPSIMLNKTLTIDFGAANPIRLQ